MIKVRFERGEPQPEVSKTYLLENARLDGSEILDKKGGVETLVRVAYIDYGGVWHTVDDGKCWDKVVLG